MEEGAREPKLPRALTYILLLLLLRSSCFSSPDASYYFSSVFPTFGGQHLLLFFATSHKMLVRCCLPDIAQAT